MLCQNCGKNPATTYFKQTINGKTKELNICSSCATKKSVPQLFSNMGFDFENFWGNPFTDFQVLQADKLENLKCPSCNETYQNILKTGKVGCPLCYSTFYDRLLPSIQRVHGKTNHTGKIPKGAGEGLKKEREIEKLKEKLAVCISNQDYEKCASLRDEIKALEDGAKESIEECKGVDVDNG